MEEIEKMLHEQIKNALEDEDLPNIYFNGFVTLLGSGDVVMLLKKHEKPVAILHASHTVAKSLAEKLGSAIASFEANLDNPILTTDEINRRMSKDVNNERDK